MSDGVINAPWRDPVASAQGTPARAPPGCRRCRATWPPPRQPGHAREIPSRAGLCPTLHLLGRSQCVPQGLYSGCMSSHRTGGGCHPSHCWAGSGSSRSSSARAQTAERGRVSAVPAIPNRRRKPTNLAIVEKKNKVAGEKDAKLAQKLGQCQNCIAAFPQECMGQLPSSGPT